MAHYKFLYCIVLYCIVLHSPYRPGPFAQYKVAPPSERNEVNLSLLSSAPESEIGTTTSKDLDRSLTDFRAVSSVR